MGTQTLLLVFVVIVQFCNTLGRHNFYEYYYSRYHKGHSTSTESIFLSTSDILASSEYETESSPPDDNSLQNNIHEATDDTSLQNNVYEPTGQRHRIHHAFMSRTLLIVGSIIAFLVIVGVIVCVCPKCCRGTEYRAHSRRNDVEPAAEVLPQQPVFIPYPVQQTAVQHFPVQYPQEQSFPVYRPRIVQQQHLPVQYSQEQSLPEYQPRIVQQQPQWSQGQHLPVQYPQELSPPEYQPQIIQTQPHCSLGQHFSHQPHQENFLPEYQPHIAQQQPRCSLGQHSYNLPEAPPPYEAHIPKNG